MQIWKETTIWLFGNEKDEEADSIEMKEWCFRKISIEDYDRKARVCMLRFIRDARQKWIKPRMLENYTFSGMD